MVIVGFFGTAKIAFSRRFATVVRIFGRAAGARKRKTPRGGPGRWSNGCGGGGSRTRVQTGNPKAFYTLSRRLILLPRPGRRQPSRRLSPLNFARRPGPSGSLSPNE
nr:MAG TPA_asm: hypothetical protein [Caudoviricetes sp.]